MTFSIIIPVYNVAPYLRECLDSVLAQTYTDWEAICVDDGSTDGSGEILDEYREKVEKRCVGGQRIVVAHQKNAGVSVARNAALEVAQGEWVLFLDADDCLSNDALRRIIEVSVSYKDVSAIRFGYLASDNPSLLNACTVATKATVHDISHRIEYEAYYSFMWQFAFRRNVIAGLTFPRYIRGEDRVFLAYVLCERINDFVSIDDQLYFYRQRQGSAMNSRPSVQVLKDELSSRVDMLAIFDRCGKEVLYARTWAFEHYILEEYLELVEKQGAYSDEEQRELMDWFYREQARFSSLKGFTGLGHLQAKIYGLLPGRTGRKLVKTLLPRIVGSCMVAIRNPKRALRAVLYRIGII